MKKFNEIKKGIDVIIASSIIFLSACENSKDNKIFGQIIGAAVGGYVGSKIGSGVSKDIAVIIGGATGYILGGKLIEILEEKDKEEFNNVIEESLNNNADNSSASWESSIDNTTTGTVIPLNNYNIEEKSCRDFKKIIKKNGESFEEKSTACRDETGDWVLI